MEDASAVGPADVDAAVIGAAAVGASAAYAAAVGAAVLGAEVVGTSVLGATAGATARCTGGSAAGCEEESGGPERPVPESAVASRSARRSPASSPR